MQIKTVKDLDRAIAHGPYAWPGAYPVYYITNDGAALSFDTVKKNYDVISEAIRDKDNTGGWRVIGVDINYEDTALYDDHTGEKIESAYGEDE